MNTDSPQAVRQGLTIDANDRIAIAEALDAALDYRGDVTITSKGSATPFVGYVFDRRRPDAGKPGFVRLIPADGSPRVTIRDDEIARLEFSGRDTASGKSFETWMKKYVEKKLAGERAAIE